MASMVRHHRINDKYFYTTYSPYNFSEENLAAYRPHIDRPTHPIRPRKSDNDANEVGSGSSDDQITVVKQAHGRSIYVLQKGNH